MPTQHTIRAKEGGEVEVTLTPKEAIRHFCKECCHWEEKGVRDCGGAKLVSGGSCHLFHHNPYDSSGKKSSLPKLSPLKSIKEECLFCQGDDKEFVKTCDTPICSLHPYRFGKDPGLAGLGKGNVAALIAYRDSLNEARQD